MRIVHLTTYWSATTGGPARYVANLRSELGNRGHDVRVVTTDGGAGADVIAGPFPVREWRTVRRLLRIGPDIVHVHNSMRQLFAALVYRLVRSRARVIFTFHTQPITRQFLPRLNGRRYDYNPVSALVARFLLRSTDLITTVSDSIIAKHNGAYRLGIRHFVRIPSGGEPHLESVRSASSSTQAASERRDFPVLVSVGVMVWDWKVLGHLVCVRAVDELRRLYPGLVLLIAGDGPHRHVVEQEVAALGLQGHVRLLGNVSPEKILDDADVYVHMAMNEGCSLAIIEAMHAGKPIVAANAGGTPEVLVNGETALLVEPEPDQLAAAVQKLLSDDSYAGSLAKRAREVALQQYTWSAVGEQYATTYQSLLTSRNTA
jgi:L-malate glycosyltransferase